MRILSIFGFGLLAFMAATSLQAADAPDTRCYELRVYYAAEGKLDALNARFRDHTCKLFEKHGMTNIGYWTPLDNPDRKLIYVLAFPSQAARQESWKKFLADPDWKAAQAASETNGKLVDKMESTLLVATDFSPAAPPASSAEPRVYELRTYTATPNNLSKLLARFRDHTCRLFQKHGMENVVYWTIAPGQPAAENTLIYLLAHKSKASHDAGFDAFRDDADWKAAKAASEQDAGGPLTVKDGVQSVLMTPTDYSPLK